MPTLTLDLEARYAQVLDAFDKVSRDAERHARGIDRAFSAIGKSVAGLGLGALGAGLAATFSKSIAGLSELDDAAQVTGASVESLSSILNTLAPTGVGLEQITDLAGKLTKAMQGAGEESSQAAEAFKVLGIATHDSNGNLRSVDDALGDVAKALSGYADGANKTALAQALLGKSGAQYLPLLKDLAQLERQAATVTTEQAAAAADLEDAWRKLGVEANILQQRIASGIVPTLLSLAKSFNDARDAGLGFFDSLQLATVPDALLGPEIAMQLKAIAELRRKIDEPRGLSGVLDVPALKEELATRELALARLRAQQNDAVFRRIGSSAADFDARDLRLRQVLQAPRLTGGKEADEAKRAADARRALDALIAQSDIDDKLRQEADQVERFAALTRGLVSEYERLEVVADGALGRALEPDREGWEAVATALREIRGIDPASKLRDGALAAANALLAASEFDSDGNRLSGISFEEYEKIGSKILGLKDPIAEVADSTRSIFAPIESAFEKALVDGERLSAVMATMAQDLARVLLRQQITDPLAEMLKKSTKDLFGGTTLFGALFGGAKAEGGPVAAGKAYLVGERGPELIVPLQAGTVIPNHKLGGAGGVVINQVNHFGSGSVSPAQMMRESARVQRETIAAIREAQARGAS